MSPFVSTMVNKLMTKKNKVMPPNIKKTGYELPTAWIIKGVAMTQMEHPNQFMAVAKGTVLDGIISGT